MIFFSFLDRFDNTHGTEVENEIISDEIESIDVEEEIKIDTTKSVEIESEIKSNETKNLDIKDDTILDDIQSSNIDEFGLKDIVRNLQTIHGYVGGVITDYDGTVLLSDTEKMQDDFSLAVPIFNDIFRTAHKTSKELDLGVMETMGIQMDEGTIMMACSGENSQTHLHIFTILNQETNTLLAKRVLDKIVYNVNGKSAS